MMDVETTPFGDQEDKELFFTGKMWDEDVELYYFNARWYDPETGQFITEDPVKDGLQWFAYCNNKPMTFIDPTGLETQDDAAAQQEATQRSMAEAYNKRYGIDETPSAGVPTQEGQPGQEPEVPSIIPWPEGDFTMEELEDFKNATKDLWQVLNVHNGEVLFAGWQNEEDHGEGYGFHIKIKNADGTTSIYSHLDPKYHRSLEQGDFVAAGWHMAFVGDPTNGVSTAPHLHYEKHDIDGNPINADHEIQAALPGLSSVTFTFGYKVHPIRGVNYLHAGTDAVGY